MCKGDDCSHDDLEVRVPISTCFFMDGGVCRGRRAASWIEQGVIVGECGCGGYIM